MKTAADDGFICGLVIEHPSVQCSFCLLLPSDDAPIRHFHRDLLLGGLLGGQGIDQSGDPVRQRGVKGGSVFQAFLEGLLSVEDHIAGGVVIGIVEGEGLGIGHIFGLPGQLGELKHALPGEEDGAFGADVGP